MTSMQSESARRSASTALIVGAVLAVVGGVIGVAGASVTVATAAIATRRWMKRQEVSSSELTRQHLRRARTAVNAGADAWRDDHAMAGAAGPST
jgi:hypothetical protein